MISRAAFKSPCNVHFDFSSHRSATVILPCTLPYTVIDFVFISPRMSAFSPMVRTPSELISPSTLPSMRSSFWNLIEPLISTSLDRMSLPECSAIYFFGSIVGVALGSSRGARPLFSSVPALNDPSPIDDMGFCGMNFFSTAGIMLSAPQPVNGLAPEILFFLKKTDAKEFAGRILGGEIKKWRGLGWGAVQDPAEGVFRCRNAEDER